MAREMEFILGQVPKITVPAYGEREFTVPIDFSIDSEIYKNMFIEGYIILEEKKQILIQHYLYHL